MHKNKSSGQWVCSPQGPFWVWGEIGAFRVCLPQKECAVHHAAQVLPLCVLLLGVVLFLAQLQGLCPQVLVLVITL